VTGSKDEEGSAVGVATATNGKNQQWKIIYVDESKDQIKGLNKDFGFHVNRPFYMVSALPMNRVIECIGNSHLQIKRWTKGRVAQQFVFDSKSKTIGSHYWKGRAIDIPNNGKNRDLRYTTTNSRWW